MRLASVTIDLDGLRHYERLHGLPPVSSEAAVAAVAPSRLAELLDERRSKGTFFAIGHEIAAGGGTLKALTGAGHEVGNHTLSHDYALTRMPWNELRAEVEGGAQAIQEATGQRPVGFRAPGYTLSAALLEAVAETGHAYDSSAFPAAPYYLAKASVMALRRLQGRPSVAILDRPRALRAPLQPYFPSRGEPYARGDLGLLELPITVDPVLRLPFFGTSVVGLPRVALRALYASARRLPFLNLELHGVDLLDASDGMSPALSRAQPDLGISARDKLRMLREVLGWLAQDYELVTLRQAAERLRPGLAM